MRFVWITAVKDWWRHRRDPVGLLIWIGIPILIGGLLTMVTGGRSGVQPKAKVLVVDQDDSLVSSLLKNGATQAGGLIELEEVELEPGRKRVNNGKATALLIIPEGFGQAVINETPTTLQLFTNPSETILPGIVEETMSILVDGTFYMHRVAGEEIKTALGGPEEGAGAFDPQVISGLSVSINAIIGRIGTYVNPPAIAITAPPAEASEEAAEEKEPITLALLFLPSMLFMSLLFMSQGFSMDLWQERDQHTLRRVIVSPQSSMAFLSGKLLGGAGIVLLVSTVALVVGYAYFRLNVALLPLALLWCVLSGVMLSTMMIVMQLFTSSQKAGGVVSMAVIFPLMMIGGNFFPFEAMPDWMVSIGRLTPNGWAMVQLKSILYDRVDAASLGIAFAGVVVVSTVLFMVSAWRLRTGFARS